MARILLVDDEGALLKVLTSVLQVVGKHEVVSTSEAMKAADLIKNEKFDLMISDIRMAPMNGMELLRLAHKVSPEMAVIMVTAFSSVDTAVDARDLGVFDYVPKPFKVDELMKTVEMALKYEEEKKNHGAVDVEIHLYPHLGSIIAHSSAMQNTCDLVKRIASTEMPVLMSGPEGVRTGLIASTIHEFSTRKDKPFVAIDCRQGHEQELSARLFGGTGGVPAAKQADKGILFLDRIDVMPLPVQDAMLELIRTRSFKGVNPADGAAVDLRILASTCRDLEDLIRKGLFREELLKSFRGIKITVPGLADRKDDILALALTTATRIAADRGIKSIKLSPEACSVLMAYGWPRNDEELFSTMSTAVDQSEEGVITKSALPSKMVAACADVKVSNVPMGAEAYRCMNLKRLIRKLKRDNLKKIVREAGGDKRVAAKMLNISVAELTREMGDG